MAVERQGASGTSDALDTDRVKRLRRPACFAKCLSLTYVFYAS